MGYADGQYDGKVYLGHVKWNNDYKHVMDFGSKTVRDSFLIGTNGILAERSGRLGMVPNPNGYIDIDGLVENIENKNYLVYTNSSDIAETKYFCFITNYEILARRNTRVFIQLDVFQQYFYDAEYYKCIVERGHISKNEDDTNWMNYTAPEPVGAPSEIDRNIDIFDGISFAPILTFDAISKPVSASGSAYVTYEYGGNGSNAQNSTGYYRFKPSSTNYEFQALLTFWTYAETATSTINHLSDLVGFNFIPSWLNTKASWTNYYNVGYELNNNNVYTQPDTATLTRTNSGGQRILACGYAPVNKKLFTNLCTGYMLWTKNGVSIPIAPNELANKNSLTIKVHQRPMGSTYKVELVDYKDINARYFDLQYSYSIAFGLNNNVGTAQQTAIAQLNNQKAVLKANQKEIAVGQAVGVVTNFIDSATSFAGAALGASAGGASLGGSVQAGAQGMGGVGGIASGIGGLITAGYTMDRIAAQMDADNFNMQTAINDATNSIGASIGNNSDRSTMSDDFCRLRIAETSPTIENCRIIDDFLTIYGYTIQEIKSPSNFFRSRPLFNYVKTSKCNLYLAAPSDFENILKDIFNKGVTLWHYNFTYNGTQNKGYDCFGNYDINNFYS